MTASFGRRRDENTVDFFDAPLDEKPIEFALKAACLCEHQKAAGIGIEALGDVELPTKCSAYLMKYVLVQVIDSWMYGNARRLVDYHKFQVFRDDGRQPVHIVDRK
jgi:hypothetical protein